MGSLFGQRREGDLIGILCRESRRWEVVGQEVDCYRVLAVGDHRSPQSVVIRYAEGKPSLSFQAWLEIRFPLDNPPSGLFGKLLLRNIDLIYGAWAINIGESCEACPCVRARLPRAGISPGLFDQVCRELVDEVLNLRRELRDKFRYSVGGFMPGQAMGGGHGGIGTIGQATPQVPYIEPGQGQIGQHQRYRLTDGRQ